MDGFEYKVIYVDFRGRISAEGAEYIRQASEHRTGFVRGYLDVLGKDGWELTGVLPGAPREQLLHPEAAREGRENRRLVAELGVEDGPEGLYG